VSRTSALVCRELFQPTRRSGEGGKTMVETGHAQYVSVLTPLVITRTSLVPKGRTKPVLPGFPWRDHAG
jgi:hypothetical protein